MKYASRACIGARSALAALVAPAAVVCALAACATTTTTAAYTPITGILIRSSALVAGFGCGTGPHQVYRYVAIVDYARADGGAQRDAQAEPQTGGPPWTNVFDCFADGVFENLPSSSTGSQAFDVSIFAYDQASYDKSGLPSELGCLPGLTAAAACPSTPEVIAAAVTAQAPWTTTCTATQQQGIPVLAVCSPLSDAKTSAEAGAPDGGPVEGGALEGGPSEAGAVDGSTETGPGATSTDADTNG